MTHRSYSVAETKSPGATVKEYERFFSDMELEFGPGIVDRLKSKFTTSSSGSHSYSVQGGCKTVLCDMSICVFACRNT